MLKRTLGLAVSLCCMLFGELAAAQESVQKGVDAWLEIPDNRSGLAIVIGGEVKDRTFMTWDLNAVLETNVWGSELPFTRQYRLAPGVYRIGLPGYPNSLVKSVELNIQAKTLAVLQVFPDTGTAMISHYGKQKIFDSDFNKFIGAFFVGDNNENIGPVDISPDHKFIYINTVPAWQIEPTK